MVVLKAIAWLFFAIDAAAVVFCAGWALRAGSMEGEQAYAMGFLVVAAAFVAIGGALLLVAARRRSSFGVGGAALVLGLPTLIGLAIWLDILK